MFPKRPGRIKGFSYQGFHRYFITCCTANRTEPFVDRSVVDSVRSHFVQHARSHGFAILAYCFMPDHLHILIEGLNESSDLIRFMNAVKQRTGFEFARDHGEKLWQSSYYDHVLRAEEDTITVARYTLANPIRSGLVTDPKDYPFSGTIDLNPAELYEAIQQSS